MTEIARRNMEDLKDIRRQLKENPESRELNNRYAQACLDIAKEYTVTSQGHIFICSPSDLEAVRYVMAKIPNDSLLDGETLEEYKRLERAVTQARINRGKPGSKMGIYYALILFIVMPSMAAPVLLLWELTVLGSDHTRDPRALIYLIPVALITAALLWVGWLVERIPGWKYNALVVQENEKAELAKAEAEARQSTDSTP
ncbi:MAG: hypothetical protein KHZ68_00690 [Rothia mucilaginosa]|uniref:hypothetical protein n=2 Tax=Rothia mucilaginosa TaxID=43675 RepID=UPI001CB08C09|nr:hypothetical protein [Rothia mucilaginosa]MBF1641013.1 hypothetical protein [Rothia mucilaginosa]MBS4940196.1 hypothetical protein [Rothia mucilaginosa]UQF82508.1 MAG: hypothetical protein M3I37_06455 [Rothia mucilaginosa]